MSYQDGSAFNIERNPTQRFQLDPVDLYEYPSDDTITPLKTCALNCEIRTVEAPLSSGDSFVFDTNIAQSQYLSNDVKMFFTIPFIVTLTTPSAEAITEANFIEKVFNFNSDIVYSQYSILQALEGNNVRLNDQDIGGGSVNVPECFNIVAPYYAADEVDEWFHSSQPDRYQSFEKYTAGAGVAAQTVKYINEVGSSVVTSISAVNDSNIFGSTTQNKYVSRTPEWEWAGAHPAGASSGCKVKCTFFCSVPLSCFGTPDASVGIPGVKRLSINPRFKTNAASHIFNIKKTGATYRYSNIVVDQTTYMNSTAKMVIRIMTPPQFMRDSMIDKATGLFKPYSISYPRILTNMLDSYNSVAAGVSQDFNRSGIQSNCVPTSIYLAVIKKKNGDFQKCASTPINFGLIKNLTIKVDSSVTNFPNIMSLAAVADSNGYDQLDPIGRLIKGFPIKIDVSKDLSLPGDTVVGATGTFNVAVEGTFINQGQDAADYQLVVVVVNAASLNYDGANFSVTAGAMVSPEVLNQENFLRDTYAMQTRSAKVIGAGFFGNAAKWVKKNAINAWNNRDNIAKAIGEVNKIRSLVMGGNRLPPSNISGAGGGTRILGAGDVKRSVFK